MDLDFLDEPEGSDETTAAAVDLDDAETQPAEDAAGGEEPSGEDTQPASAGASPAEAAPAQDGGVRVPLGELLSEREKRQRAEADLAEFRRKAEANQTPQAPPDRIEDPEGYEAWQQEQQEARFADLQRSQLNDKLNFSERLARKEYGAEVVDQAKAWAVEIGKQDPTFSNRIYTNADPYEFVVQEYQRQQAFAALSDPETLAAFRQWQAGAATGAAPAAPGAQPSAAQSAAKPQQPSRPTRSIASAPAAGGGKPGDIPAGPGSAFDGTFQ